MAEEVKRVAVVSLGNNPNYLIDVLRDGFVRLLGPGNVCCIYVGNPPNGNYASHSFLYGAGGWEGCRPEEVDLAVVDLRRGYDGAAWFKSVGKKVAAVDGEDLERVFEEFFPVCDAYFKREALEGVEYPSKVFPLAMAAVPEPKEKAERMFRGVFVGSCGEDREERRAYREAARRLGFLWVEDRIPRSEYLHLLSRSRIGVSLKGAGRDTYRFWETAYHGAYLMAERTGTELGGAFEESRGEASYFGSPEEFESKAREMTGDLSELERRRSACGAACLGRNMSVHRAKRVLDVMGGER